MFKYTPSLKQNNSLKDDFVKRYNTLLYKVEKKRIHPRLSIEELEPIIKALKTNLSNFESALGTGREDVYELYSAAKLSLKTLEKKFNDELISEIEQAADELIYVVESWGDVLNGKVEFNYDEFKEQKISWSKKRLLNRLNELDTIKTQFSENNKRLENEIMLSEKNCKELDSIMLKENNERILNETYRKITTIKTKIDSLNIRRSSYSACYNLLDLIYANAKEILNVGDFNSIELGKAKAFLNLGKLKQVINEPEKAISILKRMDKDVEEIAEKTKVIDTKILNINKNNTNINMDAFAYKEELMKKAKEKNVLNQIKENDIEVKKTDSIKGDY